MANSLNTKPPILYLDTSGTAVMAHDPSGKLVQAILYTVGTTAGGACEILSGTGSGGPTLYYAKGPANETLAPLVFHEPFRVPGLYLKTLEANGKVVIYLEPSDRQNTMG